MSSEIAIEVKNLSKCYQVYDKPNDRLKQFINPRLQRLFRRNPKRYYKEFWALRDVSLEIRKGETIGIIGRNGGGKSTLLQMICGTLNPTSGSVRINGRIAALLELGSGFNPEFTGRENIYMNASVLGLGSKEILERFDSIVAFADIGDFIDQPVKTYSSGMLVRLAFAVIANVDADVLVVDEALSVGDVFFSQKCMRFFKQFQSNGGTVLFVSHDTSAVLNLCQNAILLVQGVIYQSGSADAVCKTYLEKLYSERSTVSVETANRHTPPSEEIVRAGAADRVLEFSVREQSPNKIIVSAFNPNASSFGQGGAKIVDAGFFDKNNERISELSSGIRTRFSIFLTIDKHIDFPAVGLTIKDRLGQAVFAESTTWAFQGQYGDGKLEFLSGDNVRVDFNHIAPILFHGDYAVSLAIAEGYGHQHVQLHFMHEALILHSLGDRLVSGITGFSDLGLTIRVSRGRVESDTAEGNHSTTQ